MKTIGCFMMLCLLNQFASATTTVSIHSVVLDHAPKSIGTVVFEDSPFGLIIIPKLTNLSPGIHGFHLHQHPSCAPAIKAGKRVAALAAGDHYDPQTTKQHHGPYQQTGHQGDLPPLFVDANGNANTTVLAPRLKEADLVGRALIIHAGGDNFSDHPAALGGGGARIACGLVK